MYYSCFFSVLHSVYKCTHPCTKTDRQTHTAYAWVTQSYNTNTQSKLVQLGFPKHSHRSKRKHYFSLLLHCNEFTQFTGITFGKAKGRLEVTVSAWVSGWPLGRGGVDHSHRRIVCCCVSRRPGLNGTHQNWEERESQKIHISNYKNILFTVLVIFQVSYMMALALSSQV